MRQCVVRFLWLACLLIVESAHAQSPIPPTLDAWRGWVLHNLDYRACPLIAGRTGASEAEFMCAWPGTLNLATDATGANISQRWHVETDAWVALPGDTDHWPQQVSVDGQPAPVVDHGGPSLRLVAGNHEVRARLVWQDRPQTLRVPGTVGLVALSVDGKPVVPVQRDGDELTLGRAAATAPEADSIELRVHRRLDDGVPALLHTLIALHVSGQAREEIIGPVLPAGFVPLALDSVWPARLDADGRLRVRVQPGDNTLVLDARADAPLTTVTAKLAASPWPIQEIWSYATAPRLRITSATGAVQVDPNEAGVPGDWAAYPAFALADGATLTIDERSRGAASDQRNRLSLSRQMWLDFDGRGWFARDHVSGEMLQGWRLDAALPFAVERADAIGVGRNGRPDEALLVTHGAQAQLSGVEWRTPLVDLAAGLRVETAGASMPIVGWQDTFDRVDTTLHLPNGYQLLAAPGADQAAGSWISSWNLFGVFICAVVLLLAWRLFGPLGALAVLVYLALAHQERGSPFWSLLAAIAIALIARALPEGRLSRATEWLRRAALALLVLLALPFVADQVRYALHPQLENDGGGALDLDFGAKKELAGSMADALDSDIVQTPQPEESASAPMSPPPPPAPAIEAQGGAVKPGLFRHRSSKNSVGEQKLESDAATNPAVRRDQIGHYSVSTVVQTGAGEPGWQLGRRYQLSWSGPVQPEQTVRLVIASPWMVRTLRIVL
ncbi:MAG: hypothetical protein ABIR62_03355, partial [Dokdonella sp.]